MTIKQLKRRVVQGLVEPELFYMPFGKKITKQFAKQLIIDIRLFNTLNLNNMEYSNTEGIANYTIDGHIVIKDLDGNIVYNSKQEQYYSNWLYILSDFPYGTYKLKVIYTRNIGVVDNKEYELVVQQEEVKFTVYLKYYWVTETLRTEKGNGKYYINGTTNYDVSHYSEISNVQLGKSWRYINIYDNVYDKLICTVPCRNGFFNLGGVSGSSGVFGGSRAELYTNINYNDYSFTYKIIYPARTIDETQHSIYIDVTKQGNISSTMLDDAYLTTATCPIIHTTMFGSIYKEYVTKPSSIYDNYSQRVNCLMGSQNIKEVNFNTGELIRESNLNEIGYVNNAYNNKFSDDIRLALQAYNKGFYTSQEITEDFFEYNNYLIYKFNDYGDIVHSVAYTWEQYVDSQKNKYEYEIVDKCAIYDSSKYYIDTVIDIERFAQSYGNLQLFSLSGYFNLIHFDDITILENGYVKYGEDKPDECIRHTVCDLLSTYSDDYDQY